MEKKLRGARYSVPYYLYIIDKKGPRVDLVADFGRTIESRISAADENNLNDSKSAISCVRKTRVYDLI
jgi:hypothetical protein